MSAYAEIKIAQDKNKAIKHSVLIACRRYNKPSKRFTVIHKHGLSTLSTVIGICRADARKELVKINRHIEKYT